MATIASVVYSAFDDAPIITVNTADTSFTYHFFDTTNTEIDSGVGVDGDGIIESVGDTGNYRFTAIDSLTTVSTATFRYNPTTHIISLLVITNGGSISMAGTAQGRLFKASVSLKEPNGKTFTLSGNGIDAAGAIGELQAKLAIIDSLVTVVSAVRISGNMSSGQITAFNTVNAARTTSGTGYDDADITLLQTFNAGTATQVRETPTLRVRDVRNDLADAGRDDGSVDLGAAEIVALATAYQDPDGNTGYVPYKGRFVLS